MADYNKARYSGSLRDKSLEVANLFTQSEHWVDEQDNEGILGMYDWIASDGDLYLAEINTHLRMRNIDTNWVDFDALNTFLGSGGYNKLCVVCDNSTVGVKPQDGFLTHLSSSLSSAGITYEKILVDPFPTAVPEISSSDSNVFVMKIAFDAGNSISTYSANKYGFNNYVSSSGLYSYLPRQYGDSDYRRHTTVEQGLLPATHSNGAGVPDIVVKNPYMDLKKGNYFLDLSDAITGSLLDYVDAGYVVEEYIIPDTITGSLQTDVLRGLVLHTPSENVYLTSDLSDLRGYSARKTPVASGSNEYKISYIHNPDTFIEGTPIRMSDGSSKDIEDIQIGDIVQSYNIPGQPEDTAGPFQVSNMWNWTTSSIENAELTSSVVTGFGSDELDQYYLINSSYKIGTGATLFIKSGSEYSYKLPEYVETGMKLLNSSEEEINIDSISLVSEKTTFYSLDVEEIDTYFGSDILVHNLPPCFIAGTKILMSDGTEKNIEDIIAGDVITSYKDGSYVSGTVTELLIHPIDGEVEVAIVDKKLIGSPDHPIFYNGTWSEIKDSSIPFILERMYVDNYYNLEIDGLSIHESEHNYIANGCIVSGFGNNLVLNGIFQRQDIFKENRESLVHNK